MSEPSGTTWKRKMTLLCDEDPIGGGKQTFSGMGNKENNVFFCFLSLRGFSCLSMGWAKCCIFLRGRLASGRKHKHYQTLTVE